MKKWLLVALVAAIFASVVPAMAAGPTEEPETYYCWFTSQVVNIDDFLGFDQYGNPEPMARVDFGYYYYDSRSRSYKGVSTFFVYAGKDWTPTLREAYFDPRRPSVSVGADSDSKCNGGYRGWVTYVKSNPNAQYDWYSDTGRGKE